MKKDLQMELAKTQATLQNLIQAVRTSDEVDVLGSLLVLQDCLDRVDAACDDVN